MEIHVLTGCINIHRVIDGIGYSPNSQTVKGHFVHKVEKKSITMGNIF
jgi:hypothetical protein